VIGLGGSVPSFQDGKELWEGFPFNSDAEFGKDLGKLLDPILDLEGTDGAESYILMTHNGPNRAGDYIMVGRGMKLGLLDYV